MEDSRPVLAVDIGGTKLAAGLVEPGGRVLTWSQVPTPADLDAEQLWRTLDALLTGVLDEARVAPSGLAGCGCGCGGPMEWPAGACHRSTFRRGGTSRCATGWPSGLTASRCTCTTTPSAWSPASTGVVRAAAAATCSAWWCRPGSAAASCSTAGWSRVPRATPVTSATSWWIRTPARSAAAAAAAVPRQSPAVPRSLPGPSRRAGGPSQKDATAKELADDGAAGHPVGHRRHAPGGPGARHRDRVGNRLCDLEVVSVGGGLSQAGPLLFDPLEEALRAHARLEFARQVSVVPGRARAKCAGWSAQPR